MRRRRSAGITVLAIVLGILLTACCPVTAPPSTAFVARLTPLANGTALAHLDDGRQLVVSGVSEVPSGPVYVIGRLLPDGTVAVTGLRPVPRRPAATPGAGEAGTGNPYPSSVAATSAG